MEGLSVAGEEYHFVMWKQAQTAQQFTEEYAITFSVYKNHRLSHYSYKTIIINICIDLCVLDTYNIAFKLMSPEEKEIQNHI